MRRCYEIVESSFLSYFLQKIMNEKEDAGQVRSAIELYNRHNKIKITIKDVIPAKQAVLSYLKKDLKELGVRKMLELEPAPSEYVTTIMSYLEIKSCIERSAMMANIELEILQVLQEKQKIAIESKLPRLKANIARYNFDFYFYMCSEDGAITDASFFPMPPT